MEHFARRRHFFFSDAKNEKLYWTKNVPSAIVSEMPRENGKVSSVLRDSQRRNENVQFFVFLFFLRGNKKNYCKQLNKKEKNETVEKNTAALLARAIQATH